MRDSLVVAGWTLVSRVLGVVRVVVIAAVLGPTYFGNTYQASNSLPNTLFYGLLAGSLISSIVVPSLVRHVDRGDRQSFERVIGGVLGVIVLGLSLLAPLALLLAPHLLAAGAAGAEDASRQRELAQQFLVLMLPQVFLYALIACSSAIMHAQRRFAVAAAAPAVENIGCILTLLASAYIFGTGTTLESSQSAQVLLLGAGSTVAVGLHAGLQVWGARRTGVVLRLHLGWADDEVRAVLRRAVPSLAQAALGGLQVLAVLFVVNRVAGGVVAYQIALNFFFLPIALAASPVALALLPRLSRSVDDPSSFHDMLVQGLRFAFLLATPLCIVMLVLAPALAGLVSFGSMGTARGVGLVAAALAALSVGVLGETAFLIGTYASYARGDTGRPLRSMLVRVCIFAIGLATTAAFAGPRVVEAAAWSFSVAALVGSGHLLHGLLSARDVGQERLLPSLLPLVCGAALAAGPTWFVARQLEPLGDRLPLAAGVLAGGTLACVAFLLVQVLFRVPEVALLRTALRIRRAEGPMSEAPPTRAPAGDARPAGTATNRAER